MTTIDTAEAGFFGALAGDWWDPQGSSAMLHRINPLRLRYIRDKLLARGGDPRARHLLAGTTALDVGCGAGLLTEPLARMGATVTGIDAAPENVAAASAHAAAGGLAIAYRAVAVEDLAGEGTAFDLVTCMEVIEHVADRAAFLRSLRTLTADTGMLVMSTPNRTALSYATVIVGAERITQTIPRGAHDWHKFVTPEELTAELAAAGFRVTDTIGMTWRPGDGVRPRPRHVGQLLPDGGAGLDQHRAAASGTFSDGCACSDDGSGDGCACSARADHGACPDGHAACPSGRGAFRHGRRRRSARWPPRRSPVPRPPRRRGSSV